MAYPVRVLIVDDSPTMRRMIRFRLQRDARIVVVGEAGDADEARAAVKACNPDVMTLDIQMPGMSGLEFLEKLMRLRPMPVIMVSSDTREGSDAALDALSRGAIDCLCKPSFPRDVYKGFDPLPDLICAAEGARPRRFENFCREQIDQNYIWNGKVILIGASTGGVDALQTILARFPENCPPTVIAQHMPAAFLQSFTRRLAGKIRPRIQLAVEGARLTQGMVFLAPGGDTNLILDETVSACRLKVRPSDVGLSPSINALFNSAVPEANRIAAALLTGMGRDGAEGMAHLRAAGARCIVQDKESSVVFGMPRVALEIGAAEAAVSVSSVADILLNFCRMGSTLLHKRVEGRISPFPGQPYPTASVTGMPSAV